MGYVSVTETERKLGEFGFAGDDHVVPFAVEPLDVRGRTVQLGPLLDQILDRHAYPEPVARLLAEACVVTVLLGTSLKFEGKFILQTRTDGPVDMLVADFTTPHSLRAYARFDAGRVEEAIKAGMTAPEDLLGTGVLALTIDQGAHTQRYQGIVELNGISLEEAARTYFRQSEQIPTELRLSVAKLVPAVKDFLAGTDRKIPWPGLDGHVLTVAGKVSTSTVYTLPWLSSPGTLLLLCSLVVAAVYRVSMSTWAREAGATAHKMRFAFLTVASVLALAYVMNLSGQTITIGVWIAGAGAAFAYLSPLLGWLGTAVTGSDTSANALFATLQQTAAQKAGLDPTLLVAANTSGGVVGKMISPQNLTIAATAVGLVGREAAILRKVLPWSIGLIVLMCLLVGLQSSVLAWMLP